MKKQQAIELFRIGFGINILLHGLVRLGPNYTKFVSSISGLFSSLPSYISMPAHYFTYLIPIVEVVAGLMIVIKFRLLKGLTLGYALMLILMIGSCLLQSWQNVALQLNYIFFYTLLIWLYSDKGADSL